jgi:cold shock CspA family protein
MDPILRSHFVRFKNDFEIDTAEEPRKEAAAFERFANYVLLSVDYPDAFAADTELLEVVSVGGADDTFIDGIGIAVNDRLVRSIDEINEIVESNRKLSVDFVFIQSKMRSTFEMAELSNFGTGVRLFFSPSSLPQNSKVTDFRELKEYVYSNEKVISKLSSNPSLRLYFVGTGNEPENEHFSAIRSVITNDLAKQTQCYFDRVELTVVDGRKLTKFCRELANSFEVQINIRDIFPLSVDSSADVKKAYAFTCGAPEFLKVLRKEDGSLRRSLFNDNVRDYLGNSGAINREIEDTIVNTPEMFLLCNNGVTVVCAEFDQIRDKLVKIENPQIVNGCQTSNTIFSLRAHANIDKIQLLVRVICTENRAVSTRIVRGTNRQNQVLEEAFEATLPFHQEVLEPYFAASTGPVKLYYERRARQYNNDPLVKRTHVVNLRILTQAFVGMFLDAPHESHRHEAKLLEKYAGETGTRKIFREDHSPAPYFACGIAWYMFEKYLRDEVIDKKYRTYKAHLLLVLRYAVGMPLPRLTKSRALDSFCEKLLALLEEPRFGERIRDVFKVFDKALAAWIAQGGSRFGIKDNEKFTELLIDQTRQTFFAPESQPIREDNKEVSEGRVLRIVRRNGLWFGFINRGAELENVYIDSRGYRGDPEDLIPERQVRFEIGKGDRGLFARNVVLVDAAVSATV